MIFFKKFAAGIVWVIFIMRVNNRQEKLISTNSSKTRLVLETLRASIISGFLYQNFK